MNTFLLGIMIFALIANAATLVELLKTTKAIHTLLLAFHQREFSGS